MAWVTLTTNDMYQVMAASEVESVARLQKQIGSIIQTDQAELIENDQGVGIMTDPPFEDLIAPAITRTTNMVRGYIDASGRYTLGPSGTVPESLVSTTLDLLVIEVWKRLGGDLLDIGEQRRNSYDEAMQRLRDVAQGNFGIAEPLIPDSESRAHYEFAGGSIDHINY